MNRGGVLWIALFAGSICALLLALGASGWAAASQSFGEGLSAVSLAASASSADPGGAGLLFTSPLSVYLPLVSRAWDPSEPRLFPNCRFGVAGWEDQMVQFNIVSTLGAGWYMDFGARVTPPGPPEAEYAQMIRLGQGRVRRGGTDVCGPDYDFVVSPALTDADLGVRVDANPGALWIVGNEPDRVLVQDDICPQQYAEAYHDVYHFIKGRDPTAQVANAGLVEVTPARLQYLDIVWETYLEEYGVPMPVDVWTMHIYILSEHDNGDAHVALGTDPDLAIPFSWICADPGSLCQAEHDDLDIFVEQVVAMRQWMKDHGQQNRPLLLAEYSLLKPYHYYGTCASQTCPPGGIEGCFCDENSETFHPERVADFMEATYDYLSSARDPSLGYPADEDRLVQQWLWFSLYTDPPLAGHCSNLIDPGEGYALMPQGQRFRDYAAALPPEVNLFITQVGGGVVQAPNGADPVTATLTVAVMNNGNVAVDRLVTVTFYRDEPMTLPIGSTSFTGLGGCARREVVLTTTWESLDTGFYPFWVKVDSAGVVAETKETDNTAQGSVLVNPVHEVFVPAVFRQW